MRSRITPQALLLAIVFLLGIATIARAEPSAAASPTDPAAEFDRGVELLQKDPFAAKVCFRAAADGFERHLTLPLTQWDRARLWYNIGTARQLAEDHAQALLALRRADLLAPAIPGLGEHLASARRAVGGDTLSAGAEATPTRQDSLDVSALARVWALSIPKVWLWRIAITAWVTAWTLMLLRMVGGAFHLQPTRTLVVACFLLASVPAATLAIHEFLENAAAREVVLLADANARTEPDDLTGGIAPTGALKAGTEFRVVERRVGGNGEPWVRVRASAEPTAQEPAPMWLPASAVESVLPPETPSPRS